jgi:hypothetical protein
MCMSLAYAAEALPASPLPDPDSAEVWSELRAINAARPEPMPLCPCCRRLFVGHDDGGWLLTELCGTCELNRFEELITALVIARDKPSVKRALKALKRLRERA